MAVTKKIQPSEPPKVDTAPLATTVDARSGSKVVVACKLPNGLVLHLEKETKVLEQRQNGPPEWVTLWVKDTDKPEVRVHGNRVRFGDIPSWQIVGGYGLTENVDRDFWVAWLEKHEKQPYVVNELIWAEPTMDAARSRAKNQREVLSNMEPLNPATKRVHDANGDEKVTHVDPRWPRRITNTVGSVSELGAMER